MSRAGHTSTENLDHSLVDLGSAPTAGAGHISTSTRRPILFRIGQAGTDRLSHSRADTSPTRDPRSVPKVSLTRARHTGTVSLTLPLVLDSLHVAHRARASPTRTRRTGTAGLHLILASSCRALRRGHRFFIPKLLFDVVGRASSMFFSEWKATLKLSIALDETFDALAPCG